MTRSHSWGWKAIGSAALLVLVVTVGCSHVNRDELATELDSVRSDMTAQMQEGDAELAGRIDGVESDMADLEADVAANAARLEALEEEFNTLQAEYGVTIERLEGMIVFTVPVHFGFDSADIRDNDKPVLDHFSTVVQEYYDGSLITVEGFTDPAGSEEYNKVLGKRRAEGVRSYLTEIAGLDNETIRAVSYGEAEERQVEPGAWGKQGMANRRVTLVIDYTGVSPE